LLAYVVDKLTIPTTSAEDIIEKGAPFEAPYPIQI